MKISLYKFLIKNKEDIIKYWPIIPTLTLLLGSVWQIFSLSSISISYLRFFSTGQLLSDSLILLLVLSILAICLNFLKNVLMGILKYSLHSKEPPNFPKIFYFYPILFLLSLLYAKVRLLLLPSLGYLIDLFNPNSFNLVENISGLLILSFLLILFSPILIKALHFVYWQIRPSESIYELGSKIFSLIGTILIFVILINVIQKSVAFHTSYSLPEKNINLKRGIFSLKKEFPKDSIKVLYFNNEYVFYAIGDSILVKKLDSIL